MKRHETICRTKQNTIDNRSYCLIIFDLFFQVNLENIQADAYLVIFSIAHRDTFDVASDLLSELRVDLGSDRPIVLVGNKLDLVRKRKVNTEGKMRVMFSLNRFFLLGRLLQLYVKETIRYLEFLTIKFYLQCFYGYAIQPL